MTDDRRRRLERAAAQGDLQAQGQLLLEHVRAGELPAERLELLADARDPVACTALGKAPPRSRDEGALMLGVRGVLAAAIVWTVEHASVLAPATSLRSESLRPDAFFPPWNDPIPARIAAVERLSAERGAGVSTSGWPLEAPLAHGLAGGRLLLFDPDATLSDGAAEHETEGFYDADNLPPWDTWVHYAVDGIPPGSWRAFRSYLVCYVPPALVEVAQRGLDVNPEDCIAWAEDVDGPFTRDLRGAGLIAV